MPLAVFSTDGTDPRLGKIIGDAVVDLSIAAPSLPGDVIGFLEAGKAALAAFAAVDAQADGLLALAKVRLYAPIPKPEKFLAIGLNYGDHISEAEKANIAQQTTQIWFNKQVSCIVGPHDDVAMPAVSDKLDYEAELAVVIGRRCRHVSVGEARTVIGGYMIANDVSVRDWQIRTPTMTLGKSFDTHGPTGPWLTLDHEVRDPHDLDIRMLLNGEQRQSDNSGSMIHNIYEQIAYLSTVMTLNPGDILATGTPAGVGAVRNPPAFLQVGDVMRVEIEGLGALENRVVAEPVASAV